MPTKEEDFAYTLGPSHGSSSPFSPLSRRGLNPIKPVYDPDRPDGRLNLTASAFNQLGQYTSSPGRRGYVYAELAVFFPSGGRTIASTHCISKNPSPISPLWAWLPHPTFSSGTPSFVFLKISLYTVLYFVVDKSQYHCSSLVPVIKVHKGKGSYTADGCAHPRHANHVCLFCGITSASGHLPLDT